MSIFISSDELAEPLLKYIGLDFQSLGFRLSPENFYLSLLPGVPVSLLVSTQVKGDNHEMARRQRADSWSVPLAL